MNSAFQVVLLAGGKGQNLYPLSEKLPKPMLPIANKPMISYVLENLQQMGFIDILVIIKPSNTLRQYLEKEFISQLSLKVLETDDIYDLDVLANLQSQISKQFIIMPCDLLAGLNLNQFLHQHIINNTFITMVMKTEHQKTTQQSKNKEQEEQEYDVVLIDEQTKRVLDIQNADELIEEDQGIVLKKQIVQHFPAINIHTDLSDLHVYICSKELIDYTIHVRQSQSHTFTSLKHELIPFFIRNQFNNKLNRQIFKNGRKIRIGLEVVDDGKRVKTINDYIQVNMDSMKPTQYLPKYLLHTDNNGPVTLDKRQSIDTKSNKIKDSLLGEGCELGINLVINKSVISKNTQIANNCKISNSIIHANVKIAENCVIQNSIICKNAQIGKGSKIKDNSIVAQGLVVEEGSDMSHEQLTNNIQFQ